MSRGLAITFDLLTTTPNEAAVDVLLAALNSSRPEIRLAAMRSLIARPSPTGHREILRRVSRSDELLRRALAEGAGFMEPTLRQALTGPDWKECFAACQIVLWSREYDLLPALLALMPPGRAADHPHASLSRTVTLQLAELLFEELHGPRSTAKRRDPQACRGHAVASLERWLRQAAPQPNREVVEAYVTLSHRDDAGLRQILHDPHDPSRDAVLLVLGHSRRTGVLRLLASFIDDPHSPLAALRLISGRGDVEFVTHLLNRLGDAPSAATAENLRRIETLAWAIPSQGTLDELDGEAQRRALAAILTTSLSDAAKFRAVGRLARRRGGAGRVSQPGGHHLGPAGRGQRRSARAGGRVGSGPPAQRAGRHPAAGPQRQQPARGRAAGGARLAQRIPLRAVHGHVRHAERRGPPHDRRAGQADRSGGVGPSAK
jgi:hypothetical protein